MTTSTSLVVFGLLLASACAAPGRGSAAASPTASSPAASQPPVPIETAGETPAVEPIPPESGSEPAQAPPTDPICKSPELARLLAEFEASERSLGDTGRDHPLSIDDLERVTATSGSLGDASAGPGVFGSLDADGDGRSDLVLHYASVDYWAWLVFVKSGDCLRFVDKLEGYQVEFSQSSRRGMRDARVFTYPLQGRIETLRFDGSRYLP